MSAVLKIPTGLQPLVNGAKALELSQGTLDSALSRLDARFPGIRERLIDEFGEVHGFINIFVNGDDIVYLQGLLTQISDGTEVDIVPSIAGGA